MNIDTTGGVSPLKARQSSRGGKHAGAATAKASNWTSGVSGGRGGFAKSAGARGAGGRNVGGYNVQTRFAPSKRTIFPASGGTTSFDTTKQAASSEPPYYYDKDGNIQMTEYKQDPDTEVSKRKSKGTFNEVWDANEDNFQDEWKNKGGKEAWKKQAQKEIDEGYYTETKTEKGKKWSRTYSVNKKTGKRVPGSESEWTVVSE